MNPLIGFRTETTNAPQGSLAEDQACSCNRGSHWNRGGRTVPFCR